MDFNRPHRRYNPLIKEWVLVSPHRAQRPWLGQVENLPGEVLPQYDPTCYLCPGNRRTSGIANDVYTGTFIFDNDHAALLPPEDGETLGKPAAPSLYAAEPEFGLCRVICFSPRHDLSLPEFSQEEVEGVVRTWTAQTLDLGNRPFINYVQVFENKGEMMGCSNPHPHSQVWSTGHLPNEPAKELHAQQDYLNEHQSCLLCDVLETEQANSERIVAANEHFTALVPFWGVWPFEILLIGQRHVGALAALNGAEVSGLADILRQVTIRFDNLFEISFPYSMGFHQAPTDGQTYPAWHLHAHFIPPLLRSATVRKFMVGFELLAMPQRDITPETAAARLRSLSPIHYRSARQ